MKRIAISLIAVQFFVLAVMAADAPKKLHPLRRHHHHADMFPVSRHAGPGH